MIILDTTTRSLQVRLAGAITTNQLPVVCSYVDVTATGYAPGSTPTVTNGGTAVTVAAAPAVVTQRQIKLLTVQNADTVNAVVTVIYNDNATLRNMVVVTLAAGDQLTYTDGEGFRVLSSAGGVKQMLSGGVALTKADDTNVTLTLGGSPESSLIASVLLTLGWIGQLSVARGGTGIAAFGTGVAAALGVNVGTAGAFVAFNGALGTPSSGSAANLTNFPTFNQNTTGNAATATALATARTIGGTSFDGTANIAVGLAATATILATTRAIYGNNFDGSAALTQIIASTFGGTGNGFTRFSGPTTAERVKTLRDVTDTILELGGSYTPTGTWTALTLVTPALGTPASGVVTNLTGTASININGTVGATTPGTGAFTALSASSLLSANGGVLIGVSSFAIGKIYKDATSGLIVVTHTGASHDFFLSNTAGQAILSSPTGTQNLQTGGNLAVTGTGSFSGALTTNGGVQTFGAADSAGAGFRTVRVPN